MELLLETPVLLWWIADDVCLTNTAQELIAAPEDKIFVSATIKKNLDKLIFEGN